MRDSECRTVDDLHCDFALLGGEKKIFKICILDSDMWFDYKFILKKDPSTFKNANERT